MNGCSGEGENSELVAGPARMEREKDGRREGEKERREGEKGSEER